MTNTRYSFRATMKLFAAIKANDIAAVRTAILERAEINSRNSFGETPLHWAAAYDREDIARFLVASGANVSASDGIGRIPREYADNSSPTAQFLKDVRTVEHGNQANTPRTP